MKRIKIWSQLNYFFNVIIANKMMTNLTQVKLNFCLFARFVPAPNPMGARSECSPFRMKSTRDVWQITWLYDINARPILTCCFLSVLRATCNIGQISLYKTSSFLLSFLLVCSIFMYSGEAFGVENNRHIPLFNGKSPYISYGNNTTTFSATPCCQLNARLHRKIAILIYVSQNVLFYIIITYRRLNTLNTNTNENNYSKRYFDCSDNVINMHFRELIFQNTKITHRTIFAVFMAIRISRFRFDVIIVYEKIGFWKKKKKTPSATHYVDFEEFHVGVCVWY